MSAYVVEAWRFLCKCWYVIRTILDPVLWLIVGLALIAFA
jgi:hypothetical protein